MKLIKWTILTAVFPLAIAIAYVRLCNAMATIYLRWMRDRV